MAKLTKEQKEKRAATRAANKEKEKLQEKIAHREFEIKQMRRRNHRSAPTRMFTVGQRVESHWGYTSEIIGVFDDGMFYEIYTWGIIPEGTQNAGSATESTVFSAWTEVFPCVENPNTEILSVRDQFNMQYFSQHLDGLLSRTYSQGVDFDADYQRELVWVDADKQSLIDSIMESRDIGKFVFMHLEYGGELSYQVVDGKQRLTTICAFYEDRFKWRGKYFSELSERDRDHFGHKSISVAEVEQMSRKKILELFLFVNDAGQPISKEHIHHVRDMLDECS